MQELQAKILGYKPKPAVEDLLKAAELLLLVGPTGSGKNTLEQELLKTGRFKPIVTHTTRPPRYNHGVLEKDGEEYHFISNNQAIEMLNKRQFIEAAYTHGYLYGTSTREFAMAIKQQKIAVADIDIKGVKSYRQLSKSITSVFLLPPNFDILLSRLSNRYGQAKNQEDIKIRLATALDELYELISRDYYYVVINEDIKLTTKKVLDIVAGKLTQKPAPKALKLAEQLINDVKAYLNEQAG